MDDLVNMPHINITKYSMRITVEMSYFNLPSFVSLQVLRDTGIAVLRGKAVNKGSCFFLGIEGLVS
jgi:hypothetical protein